MANPVLALVAILCLLIGWWWLRRRTAADTQEPDERSDDALDTLAAWPPEPSRVLTTPEQRAYQLLVRSLPSGYAVLAQVPLSRFLRVPTRHSYREWVRRVGQFNADLLVCDNTFQVIAAINIRPEHGTETPRGAERHDRMDRVLQKAGLRVLNWREDELPKADLVQELVFGGGARMQASELSPRTAVFAGPQSPTQPQTSEGTPPEPDSTADDPLPSTFFDDLDSRPVPLPRPRTRG